VAEAAATWIWGTDGDIGEIVKFVTARRLREVYLSVPPNGVDERTAALATALRANGIAVSCLGGDPRWTVEHDTAVNWAFRATTDAVFDGVHLDVEPWALPNWPEDAATLMASYSALVEEVAEVAPLAVDIVPWLVDEHLEAIRHVVRQCDSVTVLAYRDRAPRIFADSSGIRGLCERLGRRYRIGVETQRPSPSIPADITFGDDGEAVLRRELATVTAQIPRPLFDGFAVHHLGSWRNMPP
jgi:hypothetical protein